MPTHENTPRSARVDWARPVVLAASCLILGFVAGWALRGGEDSPIIIPAAASEPATTTAERPTTTAPATETATTSTTPTAPQTVTEVEPSPPAEPSLPDPADIPVAVLNGSGVTGLAGETAKQIEGLGYTGVTAGNTTTQTGSPIIYYRTGGDLAARRLAQDLGYALTQVKPLSDAALVSEAPATAQVILVLGSS